MAEAQQPEFALASLWQRCVDEPADSDAWEELLRRLLPTLAGMLDRALRRVPGSDRADVDDLLQDVCCKIWELSQSRRQLPLEDVRLLAYFRKIAVNAAISWIRRRRTLGRDALATVSIDDRLPLLADSIGTGELEQKILIREVERLLQCSQRDRAIFWLYYRRGYSAAMIAAIESIQLTVKGVESRIHYLTADLRERMRKPR